MGLLILLNIRLIPTPNAIVLVIIDICPTNTSCFICSHLHAKHYVINNGQNLLSREFMRGSTRFSSYLVHSAFVSSHRSFLLSIEHILTCGTSLIVRSPPTYTRCLEEKLASLCGSSQLPLNWNTKVLWDQRCAPLGISWARHFQYP